MILLVTPQNRHRYSTQIDDYFRIRKQVFHDLLRWDVQVHGEQEYDVYDRMPCNYILSIDGDGTVEGGLRQMSMAGPTLTWEKFSDMIDDPSGLFAPDVWETTRFAVRPEKKDVRFMSGVNRVAVELCAASLETGLECGAKRHVAVCEERVIRLTRSFRMPCTVLGRKITPRGEDILCVAWEVSDESVERLAWAKSHFEVAA